jgi:hypothetical protein
MKRWNSSQWSEFNLLLSAHLDANHPTYFTAEREERATLLDNIRREWVASVPDSASDMDMITAFGGFKVWFSSYINGGTVEPLHSETLSFKQWVNYGQVGGEWGASAVFNVAGAQDRRRAYNALYEIVKSARLEYEQLNGFKSDTPNNAPQTDTCVLDAIRLTVEVRDGQARFRVCAEPYSKFGVPIYPEVLERSGFKVGDIPIAGLDLTGKAATILMQGGMPKKVVRLE